MCIRINPCEHPLFNGRWFQMKGFDAFYMVGELSEDGEWQWNGTEWIPAQPQNNQQSELMEHVPELSLIHI